MQFRHGNLTVYQMQMCKRLDSVPLTRSYMYPPDRNMVNSIETGKNPAPAYQK
jgi:hypothetical protein